MIELSKVNDELPGITQSGILLDVSVLLIKINKHLILI